MCVPAESLTTQLAAFLVKHTSGIITATIDDSIAARLAFPLLSPDFTREAGRFCVAVDGKSSSTGISAHDRAVTIRKMADASSTPADFNRPGHVIPVLTGGIFAITRWCRYDAAAAASKEAGLSGVVASAGLVHGVSTTTPEHVSEFGRLHDVPIAAACDALPE
ncbi:3,4-dihydroxy-2-butanone 4-phosphate synthase family protein [Mycolicibacterium hassiacum DSM 44199]|uniref:3,4-dihydroxy-2-butanone-4-phosphate synthase n=1 Tax=Mycolicibacterium hassiacum (strain DSM 44199 / CIP 105218 / JCM 12690 / 3849) TaxID=1122247 RepID=K5BCL3_MYCHD|nr:3,4-dihydroxy-2-butanone 4-phosphate synthase family protein [Mycolicibacterium hassiacum DSM 44199]